MAMVPLREHMQTQLADWKGDLSADRRAVFDSVGPDFDAIPQTILIDDATSFFPRRRGQQFPEMTALRRLMIWAIVMALGFLADPALADRNIEGRVTAVRDVDTIVVAGIPVRLNGVDGPEVSNRAGRDARIFMTRLVRGEMVSCDLNGERTYDRWVGVCYPIHRVSLPMRLPR